MLNKSAGCPKCQSIGESKLLSILKENGVNFVPQYTIDNLKYKKALRFDAFDIDNSIAFEYNGEQHYMPVDWGCKGKKWANDEYSITIKRDKLKIDYCKQHNIDLVVIPYYEIDNMEEIISSKYKSLT